MLALKKKMPLVYISSTEIGSDKKLATAFDLRNMVCELRLQEIAYYSHLELFMVYDLLVPPTLGLRDCTLIDLIAFWLATEQNILPP